MGSHLVTALILLLSSWKLLLAHIRPDFDPDDSLYREDALKYLFQEPQDGRRGLRANSVFCGESAVKVVLPQGSYEVNIIGLSADDPVLKCPHACGCSMVEKNGKNILEISYSDCQVLSEGGRYILRVLYRDSTGQSVATVSCAASPSQMASTILHCSIRGSCSYDTVSKEAAIPSTPWDSVPWMPPRPENPRDVLGMPFGAVPMMPFGSVPMRPFGSVPWTPLTPEKPIRMPGMWPGSVSSTAIAQENFGGIPDMTLTLESPRDVPGKPLGYVPWMPNVPGMTLVPESPRDVPGKPLGYVPWMPNVPGMTLVPESPRDVPGKPLGYVPWMPNVPVMTLAPESSIDIPVRFLGSVPWMPIVPRKLGGIPDMTLVPESSIDVPVRFLGSVPWMPIVPKKFIDVPDMTLSPESFRDVFEEPLGPVPEERRGTPGMTMAPESPREDVLGKLLSSVSQMPPAINKPLDVGHRWANKEPLGFDPWMTLSPKSPRDVLDTTPETSGAPRPSPAAMMTFLASRAESHMYKQGGCSVPTSQRLPCLSEATADQCLAKGCCVDPKSSACYYPMNECTADRHFVFAVPFDISSDPLDLAGLTVAGKDACGPVIVNEDVAIFKFRLTECGTHSYQVGLTTIYFAEVQSALRTLNLKHGIITRDEVFRLIVECRYSDSPDAERRAFASAGYMVMNPSLPPLVRSKGLYGVQLRIAEDETFTKFLPRYHQPLRKLLGKPVYLEVRLNSPKPEATLLVHYCVAYPRSASSALVLLYDGCPNPFDSDVLTLQMADAPQSQHKRRFVVKAFEFVDQSTNKLLNEEIYFMCSTEVCMPSDNPCKETCFEKS